MNNETSPLRKYYRQPKLELKLPTNGLWYDDSILELNQNATVKILPMSGLDEIKAQTPELLAEAKFKYELIKSCVPEIKQPEKLCAIDVGSIMFGIHMATYGKNFKETFICPHCLEKASKMSDEKRKLAEENGQINLKEQKMEVSAQDIINLSQYATTKDVFFEYEDLKIYLKPVEITIADKMETEDFYHDMIENKLKEYQNSDESNEEIIKKVKSEIISITDRIYENAVNMMIMYVDYIEMSDGTKITDRDEISDFIKNSPQKLYDLIKDTRDNAFGKLGLPLSYKVACNCCGQLVDINTSFFNPTNFFDIAS